MKNPLTAIIKLFQPRYAVVVNMYHVVPMSPVMKHSHRHDFGKGELDEAQGFFNKVVAKHHQIRFPNSEIYLIKGKRTVVDRKTYGPLDMVKKLKVKSA